MSHTLATWFDVHMNTPGWIQGLTARRWLMRTGIALAAFAILFHLAGGWYFAGKIESGGLAPEAPTRNFDVEIVSYDSDHIVLAGDDDAIFDPGTYAIVWDGGRATIGEIVASDDSTVTRAFVGGDAPPLSPIEVDIDAWIHDTPGDAGLPYTNVSYVSPLGEMAAWRVSPLTPTTTWAIHIHGWRTDRREAIRSLRPFHDAGIESLVVTYRNDPQMPTDPSGRYRFGRSEWRDIEAAVAYAQDQGAEQVVLSGFSTGGAIALAFLAESELANIVSAVVLDSPNLDFGSAVQSEASRTALIPGLPLKVPRTLTATAMAIADLRFDIGWDEINYVDDQNTPSVPILIFHGSNDETVPLSVSQRFTETNAPFVRLVMTDAPHVRSWNVDPVGYEDALSGFLKEL